MENIILSLYETELERTMGQMKNLAPDDPKYAELVVTANKLHDHIVKETELDQHVLDAARETADKEIQREHEKQLKREDTVQVCVKSGSELGGKLLTLGISGVFLCWNFMFQKDFGSCPKAWDFIPKPKFF